MPHPYHRENAELLVACARLSLQAIDRMVGTMPPDDSVPANEMGALMRLISGALNFGIEASRTTFNERSAANEDAEQLPAPAWLERRRETS